MMPNRAFPLREPDPKRLADALRADLEAFESDLRGMPSSLIEQAGTSVREFATAVGHVVRDARFWRSDCTSVLAQQVRRRPFTACALSLVVGALVVAAIRR